MIYEAHPPHSSVPVYIGNLDPDHPRRADLGDLSPLDRIPNADTLPRGCRDLLAALDVAHLVWQLAVFGDTVSLTVREPCGLIRRLQWLDGVQNFGPRADEFGARFTPRPAAGVVRAGPARPPLHADYWDVCKVTVLVIREQFAAASFIMRHTGLDFARVHRVLDLMEGWGFVGPAHGSIARDVLRPRDELGAALDELRTDWQRTADWLATALEEGTR